MDAVQEYKNSRDKLFEKLGVQCFPKYAITKGTVKKIHYLEAGKGEPLILIHGGGSTSSEWLNIIEPLSRSFRLLVVDRPGCGLTDKINYRGVNIKESAVNFIGSFMDSLGIKKAFFMGQSMGGFFSICFALKHPERVNKLLLIGAPAGMNKLIPWILRIMGTRRINKLLIKTVASPSLKNVKNIHQQILVANINKLPGEYLEHVYFGQLIPGAQEGFLSLLENVLTIKGWRKDLYIGNKLDQLRVPVRFIWGDKDAFEKPATGIAKASVIKDLHFETVNDAGHCPWLDQPEKCSSLAVSLLKK